MHCKVGITMPHDLVQVFHPGLLDAHMHVRIHLPAAGDELRQDVLRDERSTRDGDRLPFGPRTLLKLALQPVQRAQHFVGETQHALARLRQVEAALRTPSDEDFDSERLFQVLHTL
ncbi:MAG: hypothetical protein U5Q44_07885 [Dehalococcoidia bacterium]|nr:hypothetical protein [Dehalococcoidia bacterium]